MARLASTSPGRLRAMRQRILGPPFYRRHPLGVPRRLRRMIDRRIWICPSRRFVYVRVPKAANTTVKLALRKLIAEAEHGVPPEEGDPSLARGRDFRARFGTYFRTPSELSGREAEQVDRECVKFIVTRNPYTRVLSAYLDKVAGGQPEKAKVLRRLGGGRERAISFAEFCAYPAAGGVHDDPHWCRQHELCPFPAASLDHHVRFEALADELPPVLECLFGPSRSVVLPARSAHPTGASRNVPQHYDEETRGLVACLYKADFEAFGYDPTDFPAGG